MEENAWEQRLQAARTAQLQADPTLTDLDLRRQQAATEWSAYGKPRFQEAEAAQAARRRGVKVMEREMDDDDFAETSRRRSSPKSMSDAEIQAFELEYGIAYDPYYDEPYRVDELPDDVDFTTDKQYGDRIYANGEIFYKDDDDVYYRQGAKPRNLKFWES